jgi:SpoVK/Ycf46/Vps4 family AAA+-type ATPase
MPIVLDLAKARASYVGETEKLTRQALGTIDAAGRCVVLVDEIEKSLAGTASSARSDGGTGLNQFSIFLKWLSEKSNDSYVIATANDVTSLPPELLRSGRFDAIFYCDLPDAEMREEILSYYMGIYDLNKDQEKPDLENWTGAEIKSLCNLSSMMDKPLVEIAENYINPIYLVADNKIDQLREWAKGRTVNANHFIEDKALISKTAKTSGDDGKPQSIKFS